MLKIPINLLVGIAVFIIFLTALFLIFGTPQCDSLANQTAYSLKLAIDEVASNSVRTWTEDGVPPNNEPSYYRTAPVLLCQEKGIGLLESFFGSEPQYKIYHERFPEGGGGIWTEAYPWSGGAASTLKFWAAIRIGTGAFKLGAKYLTWAGEFSTFFSKLKWIGMKIKNWLFEADYLDEIVKMARESDELMDIGSTKPATGVADWLITAGKRGEAAMNIDEAARAGIIVDGYDDVGKRYVISKTPVAVELPVEFYEDGKLTTYYSQVFVQKDAAGNIIDMTTDINKGWPALEVSPQEMYKGWLETLGSNQRKLYEEIFVTADEIDISLLTKIKGKIHDSNFYQHFFQPVEDGLKEFVARIKTLGYRVDHTIATTKKIVGIKLGVIDAVDDADVAEMLLRQDGIRDRIARALGKSADEIHAGHVKQFLDTFELNGLAFVGKGTDIEVTSLAINKILEASENGIVLTRDGLFNAIVNDPTGKGGEIVQDMSTLLGLTSAEANTRVGEIVDKIFPSYSPSGATFDEIIAIGKNEVGLTSGFTEEYLKYLKDGWKAGDESAAINLGNFVGFVEQNKGALPMKIRTHKGFAFDYFKAEASKIIYLDGPQNIFNPGGFYAKAIFASLAVAGCEGNSICLVSKNALETPIYLNEEADKYDVRIHRPIEGFDQIKQWAGWQAALMHIPSNPRFHVVSPCFAVAKIWKTTYHNKPTIFVKVEKKGLGGEASNYCYADVGLVNQYVLVWLVSDVLTVIETYFTWGASSGAKEVLKKVTNTGDPVTLTQGIIEGFISWPGHPWQSLSYEKIRKYISNIPFTEFER